MHLQPQHNDDKSSNLSIFENTLKNKTDSFLENIFVITKTFDEPLYHYTSPESADSIIKSQQLRLSFIRSTSDPLEFALPLAECRNYLCIHTLAEKSEFPLELFKFLTNESIDPKARAYFMSFTHSPNLAHHKKMYGSSSIVLKKTELFNEINFQKSFFFIKCRYENDIRSFVYKTISRWIDEIYKPTAAEHGENNSIKNLNDMFWVLMKLCHTISLGTKSDAFKEEEEYRLILHSPDVDSKQNIHSSRKQKIADNKWSPSKEYIILNLKKAGLEAKIFGKN